MRELYGTDLSKTQNAAASGTKKTSHNAVFTDKKKEGVKIDDFLNLMVQQLANQDFMNPVDDAQYLSQMAQFATMQQMQELGEYSKSNYVMSLFGKDVTVAKIGMNGKVDSFTGPIEKVSLVNNEYTIQVKGKTYSLDQIMEIHSSATKGESTVDTKDKLILAKDITDFSVSLEWPAASTVTTSKDKVKYSVYYSTEEKFDTVEDVEKYGILIGTKDRTELTSESIMGLSPKTKYYVNVVVTDENNEKTVYKKAAFETTKQES